MSLFTSKIHVSPFSRKFSLPKHHNPKFLPSHPFFAFACFLITFTLIITQLQPLFQSSSVIALNGIPTISSLTTTSGLLAGGNSTDIIGTNFMASEGVQFIQVAAGGYHSLAIDSSGQLYSWGYNTSGQLGNNSTTNSSIPINLTTSTNYGGTANPFYGKTFQSIVAGYAHSLAIDSFEQLYAWGNNASGQLGNNSTTNSSIPINLTTSTNYGGTANPFYGKTFQNIASGFHHSLAIDSSSQLYSWGYNNSGQLGNNSTTNSPIPLNIIVPNIYPNIATVTFGAVNATSFEVISDTQITAVVPPGAAAGPVDVAVEDFNSQIATLTNCYTYYTVPDAPTLTSLTPDAATSITLDWIAPSSNGYSPIIGYKIEVSTNGGSTWSIAVANTNATSTTYNYTAADNSATYSFRVSAINAAGTGNPSNILSTRPSFIDFAVDNRNINISIVPTASGAVSSKKHTAYFTTNYPNGATLTLSTNSDTDNNLNHQIISGQRITPITGTPSSPSQLSNQTWGFAIPSGTTNIQTNFNVSYSELSSVESSASTYAAVPRQNNPFTFEATSTANPTTANQTDIYYAAKIDISSIAGVYGAVVIYSIVAN